MLLFIILFQYGLFSSEINYHQSINGSYLKTNKNFQIIVTKGNFFIKSELDGDSTNLSLVYKNYTDIDFSIGANLYIDKKINIGPDKRSFDTYFSFDIDKNINIAFHPYNFINKKIELIHSYVFTNTNTIEFESNEDFIKQIERKTPIGVNFTYKDKKITSILGIGFLSYLYPVGNFNIADNQLPSVWKDQFNFYLQTSIQYNMKKSNINFEMIYNDKSLEVGALLNAAYLFEYNYFYEGNSLRFSLNISSNGARPYVDTVHTYDVIFRPMYSELLDNKKILSFASKSGYKIQVESNYSIKSNMKFLLGFSYYNKNYIFDGEESVHLLRSRNFKKSHGGLFEILLGIDLRIGELIFIPKLFIQKTNNYCFINKNGISNIYEQNEFKNNNVKLNLSLSKTFD